MGLDVSKPKPECIDTEIRSLILKINELKFVICTTHCCAGFGERGLPFFPTKLGQFHNANETSNAYLCIKYDLFNPDYSTFNKEISDIVFEARNNWSQYAEDPAAIYVYYLHDVHTQQAAKIEDTKLLWQKIELVVNKYLHEQENHNRKDQPKQDQGSG